MSLIALGVASAIGAAVSGLASLYGSYKNSKAQSDANDINKESNDRNFEYTKYLNESQYQIQTQDMLKAGLNPLTTNGVSMSSYSGTAGQTSSNPYDYSGLSNAINQSLSPWTDYAIQKKLQASQLDNQLKIIDKQTQANEELAKINNDSAERIAELNSFASRYSADIGYKGSVYSADSSYKGTKYSTDSSSNVAKANREYVQSDAQLKAVERIENFKTECQIDVNRQIDKLGKFEFDWNGKHYEFDSSKNFKAFLDKIYADVSIRQLNFNTDEYARGASLLISLLNAITGGLRASSGL